MTCNRRREPIQLTLLPDADGDFMRAHRRRLLTQNRLPPTSSPPKNEPVQLPLPLGEPDSSSNSDEPPTARLVCCANKATIASCSLKIKMNLKSQNSDGVDQFSGRGSDRSRFPRHARHLAFGCKARKYIDDIKPTPIGMPHDAAGVA